jgi:hypothetical protein
MIRALKTLTPAIVAALCLVAAGGSSATNGDPPPGWHRIERPLSSIVYPRQVLSAATYPIVFAGPPRDCHPSAAVNQMPPDGVLVQIIEYASTAPTGKTLRVPRLPRRPHRFSYEDAIYAPFECAGRSYQFSYEQAGHALQAQIWMKLNTVDPLRRAEALRILNHFQPES